MKVLWLCNIMIPVIAEHFHLEASNKEGWLSGLVTVVMQRKQENNIELAIAFPASAELLADSKTGVKHASIAINDQKFEAYGFAEDIVHPENYDKGLEERLSAIVEEYQPDLVHCFGTEYPHTLAMCRIFPDKSRLLVGIQGLCSVYADAYFAGLPERVIRTVTFRDWLKKDSLVRQQQKYAERGALEIAAIKLAGNVTGRTAWDKHYAKKFHDSAKYHFMNETLRPEFYEGTWYQENCIPHSVFLSQGDYPIKGLHYMLLALPAIIEKFPDVQVFVAGNSIVKYKTLKDKIKISAYGRFLRKLMRKEHLENRVTFLGRLNAGEMKEWYLKSNLFVCCSSIENSPNSLGEAMLLGVPCVTADVGGISTIFSGGKDGIMYEGFRADKEQDLTADACKLSEAVVQMWSCGEKMYSYCENAKLHAKHTHDKETNYCRLMEIYADIAGQVKG